MKYSSESWLHLFNNEAPHGMSNRNVANYRVKTIKSGDLLECEIYPIWNTRNEVRSARENSSSQAQAALNQRNAKNQFSRLLHTNFEAGDLHVTLTHKNDMPMSECKKAVTNYLRRVAYYRKKRGLEPMKYLAVYEQVKEGSTKKRIHHHIIMTGFEDEKCRRDIENLWKLGYANADRLKPDDFDAGGQRFTRLAKYLMKDPVGVKRWTRSTNLKMPTVTTADKKLSRRTVYQMASDTSSFGAEIFEKVYADHMLIDYPEIRLSDWVHGAYIYVRMRRKISCKKQRK